MRLWRRSRLRHPTPPPWLRLQTASLLHDGVFWLVCPTEAIHMNGRELLPVPALTHQRLVLQGRKPLDLRQLDGLFPAGFTSALVMVVHCTVVGLCMHKIRI